MRAEAFPLPPQARVAVVLQAEQAVLGAVLSDNLLFPKIADILDARHFADPVHVALFEAIARLVAVGSATGPTEVADAVDPLLLEDVGGRIYVHQLAAGRPLDHAPDVDAKAIRAAWQRRALLDLADTIATEAGASRLTSGELLDFIEGRIADLRGAPA